MDRRATTRRKYSSSSTYRRRQNKTNESKYSLSEIVILQCMICGVIVLVVLAINIIDTPFTNNLSSKLKMAIVSNISDESKESGTSTITNIGNNIKGYVSGFLGGEQDKETETETDTKKDKETVDVFSPKNDDLRIDEDLLKEMNIEDISDTNDGNTEKKPIVPLY